MKRGPKPKKKQYKDPPVNLQPAEWLNEIGRRYFFDLVKKVATLPGMLESVDEHALSMLCAAYQDYHSAQDLIDKEGEVIDTHNGFRCQHPATKLKKDAIQRISDGLDKFGLNPRSRKRMGAAESKQDDDDGFAQFVGVVG